MKATFFLSVICAILFISCNNEKKHSYHSVQNYQETNFLGEIEVKEKVSEKRLLENDSIAYIIALTSFTVGQKVNQNFIDAGLPPSKKYLDFRIFRDDIDITDNIFFNSKDSITLAIIDEIMSMPSALNTQQKNHIDSSAITKLTPLFRIKKDEMSANNLFWYTPRSAPEYTNQNGFYLYFQKTDDKASNLRIRLQYNADDWLFIKSIEFLIDGKNYTYTPENVKRDNDSSGIWEWFDQQAQQSDKPLIHAIVNAKGEAKMKIVGRNYHKIKDITPSQIEGFKNTIDLYTAFGASY